MENFIYETNNWKITLSDDQTYFGRCSVELKRKCESLSDLTDEEMLDFLNIVKKTESIFKQSYGATMFNWTCLMNDAYKKSPPNPQVHWHCRPRYSKPVLFESVELSDPNFAHHYDRALNRKLSSDIKEKLIRQLRLKFQESN